MVKWPQSKAGFSVLSSAKIKNLCCHTNQGQADFLIPFCTEILNMGMVFCTVTYVAVNNIVLRRLSLFKTVPLLEGVKWADVTTV
jgi:hypothetical protein